MTTGTYAGLAATIQGRRPRLGATRLVAVDGPSGVGKTVFARRLAAAFASPPPIVNTDDLLDGWDDQFTFWPRLEAQVLGPIRAGRPGWYRRFDWHRGRFGADRVDVPAGPVLVLEGVSAARTAIRPELTYAVFVTAPRALRLERTLARDGEQLRPRLETWQRAEDRHFEKDGTQAHADLVVDGTVDPGPGTYFPLR